MNETLKLSRFPFITGITPLVCPELKAGRRPAVGLFPEKAAGSVNLSGDAGKVYFIRDDEALYVLFKVNSPGGIRAEAGKPPIWTDDTCEVFIDAGHDHRNYVQLMLNPAGIKECSINSAGPGTVRLENKRTSSPFRGKWIGKVKRGKQEWTAFFAVSLASLGIKKLDSRAVIGINFFAHSSYAGRVASVEPFPENSAHSPWAFHDMYFIEPAVKVKGISLGMVNLAPANRLDVGLECVTNMRLTARVETYYSEDYDMFYTGAESFDVGKKSRISIDYELNPGENSYNYGNYQKLRFELYDDMGTRVYNADYMLGYSNGLKLVYGTPEHAMPEPATSDPDFTNKKRLQIMSAIPEFERMTTREGMPSEFYVSSSCGHVSFDFNDADTFKKMAAFIAGIFPDETDRLLGATMLLHQPAFLTYANTPSLSGYLEPGSLLRHQMTDCGGFADVLAELVANLPAPGGGRYKTNTLTLSGEINGKAIGHLVTIVEVNGRLIPLDCCTGTFFFKHGNRELASVEEVVKDKSLAEKAGRTFSVLFSDMKRFIYGVKPKILWP